MQTITSWATGRPIYSRLPDCYKENPVADWLTAYFDDLLIETKAKVDDLPRQLNPLECDVKWLDFLAPLCGFTGEYWEQSYPVSAKRLLLDNAYKIIWVNKGSRTALSTVLTCFGIQHLITNRGDFILGSSKTGDPLGTTAWEYQIFLPTIYRGTSTVQLVEKLDKLYSPLWCDREIIFNNLYFTN